MGSPFDQLQQIMVNLSGREIGIDKFKPYTFGSERVNAEVTLAGQLFPAVVESGTLGIVFSSGDVKQAHGDNFNYSSAPSGNQEGIPFDNAINAILITGLQDGFPRDAYSQSVLITGQQSSDLIDLDLLITSFNARWSGIVQEKITAFAGNIRSGSQRRINEDEGAFDFSFIAGTVDSGSFTPAIVPVNYPYTGVDQGTMDFEFVTGSYQGS